MPMIAWHVIAASEGCIALSPNQRQHIPQDIGNSYPLFGKVIGGDGNKTAKKGWDIELDILPVDENRVMNVTRNKLSVLAPAEDENVEPHLTQSEKLEQNVKEEEEKKRNYHQWISTRQILQHYQRPLVQKQRYFAWPMEMIQPNVLTGKLSVIKSTILVPTSSNVVNSSFNFDAPFEQNVFEHIFPSVEVHAAIIDKFLADPRATYYETVKSHKIGFFWDSNPDPDWKIKQCYLLIIAASTELEKGLKTFGKVGWSKSKALWESTKCKLSAQQLHMHGLMRNTGTYLIKIPHGRCLCHAYLASMIDASS
jgi:hypothetical protein